MILIDHRTMWHYRQLTMSLLMGSWCLLLALFLPLPCLGFQTATTIPSSSARIASSWSTYQQAPHPHQQQHSSSFSSWKTPRSTSRQREKRFPPLFYDAASSPPYADALSSTTKFPKLLEDFIPQLEGTRLNYRAAIGSSTASPFQMKDMLVELSRESPTEKPGDNRSTGVFDALLQEKPYYVDDRGSQQVDLSSGRWEIKWGTAKKNEETIPSPHGFLICGFVAPEAIKRTAEGSSLPEGRFMIVHRVWTEETLASERRRRKAVQNEAAQHLKERDGEVSKMQESTTGAWSRLKSYGQAINAMDRYRTSGYEEALFIPLYDEQVLELAPDCIVSTRGLVYKPLKSSNLIFETNELLEIGESRVDWPKGSPQSKVPFSAKYEW